MVMLLVILGIQVCVLPLLIVTIVFVDIKDTFTVMLSSGHAPCLHLHAPLSHAYMHTHTHIHANTSSALTVT